MIFGISNAALSVRQSAAFAVFGCFLAACGDPDVSYRWEAHSARDHFHQNEAAFVDLGDALLAQPEARQVRYCEQLDCSDREWVEYDPVVDDFVPLLRPEEDQKFQELLENLGFAAPEYMFMENTGDGRFLMPNMGQGRWETRDGDIAAVRLVRLSFLYDPERHDYVQTCEDEATAFEGESFYCIEDLGNNWGLVFDGYFDAYDRSLPPRIEPSQDATP